MCGAFLLIHKVGYFRRRPWRLAFGASNECNPQSGLVRICVPLKTRVHTFSLTHEHPCTLLHACVHAHTDTHTLPGMHPKSPATGNVRAQAAGGWQRQAHCRLDMQKRLPRSLHDGSLSTFQSQRHLLVPYPFSENI